MCETNKTELLRSNLSALRKKNHLTQEQLADRLGLTFQAVSKWENGLSCPDISLLPELAEIFGVTVDDLFRENAAEKAAEPPKTDPETPSEDQDSAPEVPFDGPDLSGVIKMTEELLGGLSGDNKTAADTPSGEPETASDIPGDGPDLSGVLRMAGDLLDQTAGADSDPDDAGDGDDTLFFHGSLADNPRPSDLPWADDNTYRAVLFLGHTLVTVPVEKKGKISWETDVRGRVLSAFSMTCGDVNGSVNANGDVDCGSVAGGVSANGDVDCGNVMGDVKVGGSVDCGDITGNVFTGGDVDCGDVKGSVTAGGDVDCGDVSGRVTAGGDVSRS